MKPRRISEMIYALFFTGVASLAMLCSICDAFSVVYKPGILYTVSGLYLLILMIAAYVKISEPGKWFGIVLIGEATLFLIGRGAVGESIRSLTNTIAVRMQSYWQEGRSAAILEGKDETWGLLAVLFVLIFLVAFSIWYCKKAWGIATILGAAFVLPFSAGVTLTRRTLLLILLAFFGAVLGKLPAGKEKERLKVPMFGIAVGAFAFFIGIPLFSNQLEALLTSKTSVRQQIEILWDRNMSGKLPKLGEEDRAFGGVNDGELGKYSRLDMDSSVHLKVRMKSKPQETVYLRGFVGEDYTGDSWKRSNEKAFDTDAELLDVENVKANQKYRYHTYPKKEDIPREWAKTDSDYEKSVRRTYSEVPENIKEIFREVAETEIVQTQTGDIVEEVAECLSRRARYSLNPGKLPKGKDFAEYFFFENKKGYCTHFATTAVLLFRMEGIESRYVGGYAVRPTEFIRQEDGTYLANVTGETAHAWAEIYVPGSGWVPAETTPGYIEEDERMETVIPEAEAGEEAQPKGPKPLEEEREPEGTAVLENQDEGEGEKEALETEKEERQDRKHTVLVRLIIALVFLFSVLGVLILSRKKSRYKKRGKAGYSERAKQMFYRIYDILVSEKILSREAELDEVFAEKLCEKCPRVKKDEAMRLLDIIYRANYGRNEIEKEDYQFVRRILLLLEKMR